MISEVIFLGGRRVWGLGDAASDIGLSVDASGNASFDPTPLASKIPPDVQNGVQTASNVYAGYQAVSGMTPQQQLDAASTAIAGAMAVAVPYGTLAAGALLAVTKLFEGFAPSPATTNYNYGPYPSSTPGSFESIARPALVATWNALVQQKKLSSAGTGDIQMGIALANIIQAWNASHAGPAQPYTVSGMFPSGWSGTTDPIVHAAEGLVLATNPAYLSFNGPVPTTHSLTFQINSGRVIPLTTLPRFNAVNAEILVPVKVAPSKAAASGGSKLFTTTAVVGGLGVGGFAAYAAYNRLTWAQAWRRLTHWLPRGHRRERDDDSR